MLLNNRYQLQEPIGHGGMATIYRAIDTHTSQIVVVKMLRETYSTDPKFVKRFQREAEAISSLQHPNIVQVYDYGQIHDMCFIVMELVEGTDLRRYLRSRGIPDADLSIIIAYNVALGLGAAHHRGILHRNVKPQNILVGRYGSFKLTDFSLASIYDGVVVYNAPEQIPGEMLTSHPPFDGNSPVAIAMQHIQDVPKPPSQTNPDIPKSLAEIIMRCLEKVPDMRYLKPHYLIGRY